MPVVVLALVAVAAGVGYAVTRGEGTTVDTGDTAAASAAAASGASDTPGTTTTVAGGASTATAKKASAVDMAQIPAGTFTLGAKKPEANSAETLETKADVAAFAIDLFEVSNEQWKAFVDRKEAAAPLAWRGGRFPADRPKRPVEGVTFDWASAYCTSLGKRLPTETEWEVAARGPNAAIYPWGDTATTVALPDPDSYDVGTIAGNKSAFGVFDLAGNVWEWVDKPYDKRITAAQRVLRGGQHGYLRKNVTRLAVDPATSNAITVAGFRCAADAAAVDAAVPALAFGDFTKPQAPTPPQKAQPAPNVLLFDDFRDATSGWVERSTETARYGYHPNEYFHLETKAEKQDVLALSPAAVDPAKPISVKTKAFVDPDLTAAGGAFDYGLAFRMDKDGKGLVFVVSSRTSEWKICTRSGDMSYVLLESKGRTIPDTVEIEVRMSGDIYEFHIGGQLVTSKSIPGFTGTGAGMVLISYPGSTKAHVHYDEFQLATL